jgi:CheY-like chemotaxis protein
MRTVLNIEDSADDLLMMRAACKNVKACFRFEAVTNGEQAMAYLKGEGPYADRKQFPLPDLVLLDLKMPRTSGFQVLRWIRTQCAFRDLPVLVYSGSLHNGDVAMAQQLGANEFLIKVGGLQYLLELAKALDQAFAQEPPSLLPIQMFITRHPGYHMPPCNPWMHCTFPSIKSRRIME